MRSLKTKIILSMMEKQTRFDPLPADGDYAALRREMEALSKKTPVEKGVSFTQNHLGGVAVELATPKKLFREDMVVYIHGGGFIHGSCASSRGYGSHLAKAAGLRVCTLSYRLAPEHPFPAAAEDCLAVYQALMETYPGVKLALVGESAGGTLALTTTLWAKEKKLPPPVCIAAFSPCTTLAEHPPARIKNDDTDLIISGESLRVISDLYGGVGDRRSPHMSPLYGDYRGFPPLFVIAEEGEVLLDDSILLVKAAEAAGVQTTFQVSHGLFHAWPVLGNVMPESKQALKETAAFIHKSMGILP